MKLVENFKDVNTSQTDISHLCLDPHSPGGNSVWSRFLWSLASLHQTSNVLNLISKQLLVSIFWILKHLLVQDSVSLCAQTQCGLWYIKVLTFPIKYKIQQELPWIEWNYCFCSSESINLVTWTQASKNWNRMAKKQFLGIYFNHCFRWSEHFKATN